MKGKTKYMKVVKSANKRNREILLDKAAIPVFTMFIAPVEVDNKDSEDMVFGHLIAGDATIGMGTVLDTLKGMIAQIEKDLFTQLENNEKA